MHSKVILADNYSVFRAGAARIIAVEDDFSVVSQCNDVPRLMRAVEVLRGAIVVFASTLRADLAQLGIAVREANSLSIVVLENHENPQEYNAQGVKGIVYRDIDASDLVNCIRRVSRGQLYVQGRSQKVRVSSENGLVGGQIRSRLTPKELQIVALIVQGCKNKDIATKLKNSEQVIKNYLRAIFDKTGSSDRLELALLAIHHRVLGPPPAGAGLEKPRVAIQTINSRRASAGL